MADLTAYRLLDCGDGRKLEQLGCTLIDRQAPTAFWKRRLPPETWAKADAVHHRSSQGGGHWEWRVRRSDSWPVRIGDFELEARATPFGHVGFFAEQAAQWAWIKDEVHRLSATIGRAPSVLNLFAYTGGSTLAAAAGGADVTHVDAAHGVVDWARANAVRNGFESARIRWIVDDCLRFLQRELRRGVVYDGVILDPPTFGRGRRGEVWKIEDDHREVLDLAFACCGGRPTLVHLSSHSPGFTPLALENLLHEHESEQHALIDSCEMTIHIESSCRPLPSGACARLIGVPTPR